MDIRTKRLVIIAGVIFLLSVIGLLIYGFLIPKLPSTQNSDKTVIIDNYADYTEHISSDSFGYLGNYLYEFIKNPNKGVYHATIVNNSYSYAPESWFSKFTVKVTDTDATWKISMQTLKDGSINGDIGVTCDSGSACKSLTERLPSATLQSYLPLTTNDYIIAYQKGEDRISIVYYDPEGAGKTKALEKIQSLGFKPEDYSIEYFYGGR